LQQSRGYDRQTPENRKRVSNLKRQTAIMYDRSKQTIELGHEVLALWGFAFLALVFGGSAFYWGFRHWHALQLMQDSLLAAR
jgi:hypothetical protein